MYKIQKKIWIFFLGCVFYGQHNLRGQLSEFPIQESLYPNGTLEEHRALGGDVENDIACQYLRYFELDNNE